MPSPARSAAWSSPPRVYGDGPALDDDGRDHDSTVDGSTDDDSTGADDDSTVPDDDDTVIDEEGDGAPFGADCDDKNANAFPGNPEICDEQDNDCDGTVDEDLVVSRYRDVDGDG